MEIELARTKYCWRCLPEQVLCRADMCMGWEQEMEFEKKLIPVGDKTPEGWYNKGYEQTSMGKRKVIGRYNKTTHGWCDALPKGVE